MSGSHIPFCGVKRQYLELSQEIIAETSRVLESGQYISGPETLRFESAIKARCNRKHAIAVNSATAGLTLSLMALPEATTIGVPNFSYVANATSIAMAQKDHVPLEVDHNGLLDINNLNLLDNKINGLVYVNMFGNILDYDKLLLVTGFFHVHQHAPIIEDAAQSFGASYNGKPSGSLGDISVLSFDPTKNLPNYGSGGMVLTDDDNIARQVRGLANNSTDLLSKHGTNAAMNSRMSEVDCAGMCVKLQYFNKWQARRTEIAQYYSENLKGVSVPSANPNVVHAWHKYVIRTQMRNRYSIEMKNAGIECKVHYHKPLYAGLKTVTATAYELGQTALSLPIYPELTDTEVESIVTTMNRVTDRIARQNKNLATPTQN